jgi:hypothetical protein
MTTFEIIGVYKIVPTVESITQAVKFQKYDWLLNGNGEFADTIYPENFRNLSLIEIQVLGDFNPSLLQAIAQRHPGDKNGGEQAPYFEYYLDSSGTNLLSENAAMSSENRRACFFLHFTDTSLPLKVGEALIELPSVSELPERLVEFTNYVPSD